MAFGSDALASRCGALKLKCLLRHIYEVETSFLQKMCGFIYEVETSFPKRDVWFYLRG
jgi:hypothetical protein